VQIDTGGEAETNRLDRAQLLEPQEPLVQPHAADPIGFSSLERLARRFPATRREGAGEGEQSRDETSCVNPPGFEG
jgi:hypothetical protein